MKNYISFALAITVLVTACNNHEELKGLEQLAQQRDSLKTVYTSIGDKLKEIDAQIALLDTANQTKGVLVSTQQIGLEKFEHFVEMHGILESEKNVTINAETNGTIRSIRVSKGQKVEKGQVLLVLDSDIIQKNIDEIETAYELANTIFQRQEKLWKQNIGSEIQFLEAKNRKESMDQKLKTLKAQRDMSTVKAPFSGIVDDIYPKEGEMASPMSPLLRLINGDKFYMTADVPENYLSVIKNGTDVLVKIPSLNTEVWSKISRVGQYINPNNRTFKIQVNIENKDQMLRPNLLSVMMVKTFGADSAVTVPSAAVQQDVRGIEYVLVVNQNGSTKTAKRIDVKTGLSAKNKILISEGLTGKEEVIIEGGRGLNDNEKIHTIN
jgi:membrane fusion protein, multidrug efflux system